MKSKVASCKQVHYEIQVLSVLEGELHVDYKIVVVAGQQRPFVQDRVHRPFRDDSSLAKAYLAFDISFNA